MIYAVNTRTKEHREYIRCDPIGKDERLAHGDCDGWIPWPGGDECPLPEGAPHEVRFLDGDEIEDNLPQTSSWAHGGFPTDIIAYRPILDTADPETPEWDGEGLPPVGVECEGEHYSLGWLRGTVIAHDDDEQVVVMKTRHGYMGFSILRPLRTAEDQAVEPMIRIAEGDTPGFPTVDTIMRRLYRAGYRKTD